MKSLTNVILIFYLLIIQACSFTFPVENEVEYIWSGAVTPTSFKVNFKLKEPQAVRLAISADENFTSVFYSETYKPNKENSYVISITVNDLHSNREYFYKVEPEIETSKIKSSTGKLKTFAAVPYSFSFVVGACAQSSNHPVYGVMKNLHPLFYLNTGDLHYLDPNSPDPSIHQSAIEEGVLKQPMATSFFKEVPIAYTWDDHDFCGNSSSYYSIGRVSARKVYQDVVPHYPLPAGKGDVPIYQSFTVGRVRFILTDLRSERTNTTLMSHAQRNWFENQVLSAHYSNEIIAWVSSVPYLGSYHDSWGGYDSERRSIADFFKANKIENLFILSGDAHMIAIDNGDNSDYSSGLKKNPAKYPVFQAAALNRTGSNKGGTYSHGAYPNPTPTTGQFGEVIVNDSGKEEICIEFKGLRVDPSTTLTKTITSYQFCRKLGKSNDLKIFPNPATSDFSVIINNTKDNESGELLIYDLSGRLRFKKRVELKDTMTEIQVNTSEALTPGVYLLYITGGGFSSSSKIVIRH